MNKSICDFVKNYRGISASKIYLILQDKYSWVEIPELSKSSEAIFFLQENLSQDDYFYLGSRIYFTHRRDAVRFLLRC